MMEVISLNEAKAILQWLHADENLAIKVAKEILPKPCRDMMASTMRQSAVYAGKFLAFGLANDFIDDNTTASIEDIQKVKANIMKERIVNVESFSVKSLRDAAIILRGAVGIQPNQHLIQERLEEIMESIDSFVYGLTPLIRALNQAKRIFSTHRYKELQKFLFVLSDGDPTDGSNAPIYLLEKLGVKTTCCYITQNHIINPKKIIQY